MVRDWVWMAFDLVSLRGAPPRSDGSFPDAADSTADSGAFGGNCEGTWEVTSLDSPL